MALTVRCPHCRSPLRLPDTMGGNKAKCPKCGEAFQVAKSAAAAGGAVRADAPRSAPRPQSSASSAGSLPAARRRVRREYEDEEDDDDRDVRPNRRIRKQAPNAGLIVALAAGGSLMFVMVIVTVVIAARSRAVPPPPVVVRAAPAVVPVPAPVPVPPPKVEPAPVPRAPEVPAAIAEVENPIPEIPDLQPPQAERPPPEPRKPPTSLLGGRLEPGTKVTVRAEIAGNPPNFQGDYNKHVTENLEIALRDIGYEPVREGGLILQVRCQINATGKTISVRPLGGPVRPRPMMPKPGQVPTAPFGPFSQPS